MKRWMVLILALSVLALNSSCVVWQLMNKIIAYPDYRDWDHIHFDIIQKTWFPPTKPPSPIGQSLPYGDYRDFEVISSTDGYFENTFDGVWSGLLYVDYPDETITYAFPMHINLNMQKKRSIACVRILDLLESVSTKSLKWFSIMTTDVSIKGNQLNVKFDTNKLKAYFESDERLKGTISATYNGFFFHGTHGKIGPHIPQARVELHRVDASNPLIGVWTTMFESSVRTPEGPQDPVHIPLAFRLAQSGTRVGGELVVLFGPMKVEEGARFINNTLTGSVRSDTGKANMDLKLKNGRLSGTLHDLVTNKKFNLEFRPIGCDGKKPVLTSVVPKTIALSPEYAIRPTAKVVKVVIKGKNFVPGAMVHLDNPNVLVHSITTKNKKKIIVKLRSFTALPKGTRIGVRVLNPDNQMVTKAAAITVQ